MSETTERPGALTATERVVFSLMDPEDTAEEILAAFVDAYRADLLQPRPCAECPLPEFFNWACTLLAQHLVPRMDEKLAESLIFREHAKAVAITEAAIRCRGALLAFSALSDIPGQVRARRHLRLAHAIAYEPDLVAFLGSADLPEEREVALCRKKLAHVQRMASTQLLAVAARFTAAVIEQPPPGPDVAAATPPPPATAPEPAPPGGVN